MVDVRGDGNYSGGNVQQRKKSGSQYFAAFLKQFASVNRFSVVQSASAAEIKEIEKTMSQIENPDDLQSIAKSIRVFRMHDNFSSVMESTKKSLSVNSWSTDLAALHLAKRSGSLSNGVDDLENFTSEMEWSFFVPVVFSCVFSNWYS